MAYPFGIGDRVEPSAEGLQTFPRWATRKGTIINAARDQSVWQVKWDGSTSIQSIHADFLATTSLGQIAQPKHNQAASFGPARQR